MDYVVFIVTLQIPFLYFLWKFFQGYETRTNLKLRMFQKNLKDLDNLYNATKMSHQKFKQDMDAEIDSLKSEQVESKNHIQQLERYTGLRKSSPVPTMEWDGSSLSNKDFL